MARTLKNTDLVIASHNCGKIREIEALLKPFGVNLTSAHALSLTEPEESGQTFYANAMIKARSSSKLSGKVAIADDSGLCIPALNGAPGVHSARWAGHNKDFSLAISRIKKELEGHANHSAYFVCGLALAWEDGFEDYFEGRVYGKLKFPPSGSKGFGYDPIFCPLNTNRTFGEMEPREKHKMTHRAEAFRQLAKIYLC